MDHRDFEAKFLDAADRLLPKDEQRRFDAHLEQCTDCARSWRQYRSLIAIEGIAATSLPSLPADISDNVMSLIDQTEQELAILPEYKRKARRLVGGLFAANGVLAAILAILLVQQGGAFGERAAQRPSLLEAAQTAAAPQGFRAVTLELVDVAAAGSVDELDARYADLRYVIPDNAGGGTSAVVPHLKIADAQLTDVYGAIDRDHAVTVTLLVPEDQAKWINIAMVTGKIAIDPVPPPNSLQAEDAQSDPLPKKAKIVRDPAGRKILDGVVGPLRAVLYTADPHTGDHMRYVYHNGGWDKAPGREFTAF